MIINFRAYLTGPQSLIGHAYYPSLPLIPLLGFNSVVPSEGLGLYFEPNQYNVALKWWLGLDTSCGSSCAFCPDSILDPLGHHASTCKRGGDACPAKSSWTRFLPKILTNLPKISSNLPKTCPRSCPRCQDDAGQFLAKILAKILPKIWQDLSLLARSWPPAKILLFLARTLPKNFLLGSSSP